MVVCGVGVRRGVVVVRPFSGGRHGHVARRAGGDRGAHASGARASGAGDAVNGKYEKKTVTGRPTIYTRWFSLTSPWIG